jgi:hypothetical protein
LSALQTRNTALVNFRDMHEGPDVFGIDLHGGSESFNIAG